MSHTDNVILYAEDEETDAILFERAFRRADIKDRLMIVPQGEAVIDYFTHQGDFKDAAFWPLPRLVLLDVHMPGLSGLDVLQWLRSSTQFCSVVTLILSSSSAPVDIQRAYALGANGYLVKPLSLDESVTMAKAIQEYWLSHNRMPATPSPQMQWVPGATNIANLKNFKN
jgi:two-component system response regulator